MSVQSADALSTEVLRAAAEWFALLASDTATADQRQRWQQWLDENAAHRSAWQRVEAISRQFDLPQQARAAAGKALDLTAQPQLRRRRALKSLLGLGGAGVLGWSLTRTALFDHAVARINADESTAIGAQREVKLADGSQLWLNTDTAVGVDFSAQHRQLRLWRGEILIDTASDPTRPFIVDTTEGTLRALGTRFGVRRLDGEAVRLTVYAGRVQVRVRAAEVHAQIVAAGRQVQFTADGIGMQQVAGLAAQAWSRGILLAENVPLGEFIDELARYRPGRLVCDPAIAQLRVVGGFPLNEPDRVLDMLAAALPVRIERRFPWWITVAAR